ncbi:MAG TPA: FAD-binding oxidoreductase [Microbacterium sp.]|nr:FAD-binding oxidoreductase [Microbacterium sp.]
MTDMTGAAWPLDADRRPMLVVRPADVVDVRTAVRFAAREGLRVAAQATGHNATPLGDLGGTMLLRTDLMRGVEIDAELMIARVDAGTRWSDVTPLAAADGLAALAGTAVDAGVVGCTLGGGLSWLARSHGLAANSVTAIELVTADGVLRRVDERTDAQLFWALRGGGGSFGVVTSIEFRLYPIETVYAGALFWPIARAAEVLHAWREWTAELPASVTSIGRVRRFPPLPELPPPLAGHAFVIVEAVFQDAPGVADAYLADLRQLDPDRDTFAIQSVGELGGLYMQPPTPAAGVGHGVLLRELTREALDAFLAAAATPRGDALLSAELRHLGGALTPGRGEGGVVDSLDGQFLMFAMGVAPTPKAGAMVEVAVDDLLDGLAPWRAERDYLNVAGRPVDAERIFGAGLARLRAVKERVDPDGILHSNHPVTGMNVP